MKRFNPDKELKKAQKKGIYNPRNKMFTIVLAVVLVVFISSSFAWFTSTSGSLGAFSGKANKKLTISVVATNGSVSTSSKTTNYKTSATFTVTPNSGYVYDSVSCTNNQTATFKNNTLTLDAPTSDTTCTLSFIQLSNVLATRILQLNSPKTTAPTSEAFRYGEPSQRKGVSGKTYKEYEDPWTGGIFSYLNKAVGSSYTFDTTTGYFTLTGTTATSVSYSSSYIGYYACGTIAKNTNESNSTNNNTSNCEALYKIETVSGTNLTKATRITSGFSTSGSGLFSAQDDDGKSYYFRGEVDNNYVSFANKLWRVVRINGDGTIRVVLDGDTGVANNYNTYQGGNRDTHVGYTFDNRLNSSATFCTVAHPCTSYYNNSNNTFIMKQDDSLLSNSTANIKTYLENWYVSNLASYDNSISYSRYCNDTSGTRSSFGTRSRIYDVASPSPSLQCSDTTVKDLQSSSSGYGGAYVLKIGLLSADEINLAGYGTYYNSVYNYAVPKSYLYNDSYWWSMSPSYGSACTAEMFYADFGNVHNVVATCGGSQGNVIDATYYVRPVINLKADVQVTSGDGTQSNPYVIQ